MARTKQELRNEIRKLAAKHELNGGKWASDEEREQFEHASTEYDQVNLSRVANNPRGIGREDRRGDELESGSHFHRTDDSGVGPALAAWTKNICGLDLSSRDEEAIREYGLSPSSNSFTIRMTTSAPRPGRKLLGHVESRSLSALAGSLGGTTVPTGFMPNLERAMLDFSGVLQACSVWKSPDGRTTPWPTTNDTMNEAVLMSESGQNTDLDANFAAVMFNSYKLSSQLIRVPSELLMDSGVDMESELGKILGERLGRGINKYLTLGTGASQPKGVVTCATTGVTTASPTAITADEITDLMHSVDPAYRTAEMGCGFMMHDTVLGYVQKLKDGIGRPLFVDSVVAGMPGSLLGFPVYLNSKMASTVTANNTTIIFGAFQKYKARLIREIRLLKLVERYADLDQTGFLAFAGLDGNLLDAGTHPVKALVQHS